jgi:succinate dehydrogenase / fumarate reductase membrane anchor subunit
MRLLSGLRAWVAQRVSAVVLLVLVPGVATFLLVSPPRDYDQWRALIARPAIGLALAIGFVALLVHAWVGLRDVVLDYVHFRTLRAILLIAVALGLAASGAVLLLALAALHVH